MRQTLAILLDAYRELNARKLFWIVLGLSGLVVAVFALFGINEQGIAIAFWTIDSSFLNTKIMTEEFFYKTYFVSLGVGIWLTWIATILALVSTAPIIPDFVSSGAIELSLAKPIGRLRLFLTKYLAGLLFVVLQVSVFSLGSFLVLGFRAGSWLPSVFLAIPIVTIFFSYLYAICALLGLITRSSIASLLMTLLLWFVIFLAQTAEFAFLGITTTLETQIEQTQAKIERIDTKLDEYRSKLETAQAAAKTDPSEDNLFEVSRFESRIQGGEKVRDEDTAALEGMRVSHAKWDNIHSISLSIKTVLPKTSETIALLERSLISLDEMPDQQGNSGFESSFGEQEEEDEDVQNFLATLPDDADTTDPRADVGQKINEEIRSRSVFWIVGTSLIFEFVLLGAASWIFVRRDF